MSTEKNCGCKGIRTCLLCEIQSDVSAESHKKKENQYVYNYCSDCNLCWPNDQATASLCDFPLYLGNIKLIPEFCSKEEDSNLIRFIDRIPWMPSQSGRRKQDFGPKVNFKRKKVKIGEFKGFPKFTKSVIKKMQGLPDLSNFAPVELCNLEYTPERGSSIDPHVDDFWLWGERLVTINLNSSTVLTLVPCSDVPCECFQEINCHSFQPHASYKNETNSCKHLFKNRCLVKSSLKCLSKNDTTTAYKLSNHSYEILKENLQISDLSNIITKDKIVPSTSAANRFNIGEAGYSENYAVCDSANIIRSFKHFEISDSNVNKNELVKKNLHDCRTANNRKITSVTKIKCSTDCKLTDNNVNSICNLFRTCSNNSKICVRIALPPRSLFVLAGCARYNWFHEIKRQDVDSRRLAMTFRELSAEFLDGGKESQCGKDLLLTAKNFYDL